MTYRKILHLDLDAFFCAVEEQYDPSLRGKAFAVGGRPEARGVVASCSYAARRFGVRSAMPMARALKLCPDLTIVSSRHGVYSKVSRQVMQHLHNLATVVEQISIDEAFLDVSDLPESGEALARRLQATIHKECNLPCSLGVATNKLMAKIANDVGKASYRGEGPPNAITVVPPGQEAAFLAPLPVDTLWGVGPKTAERLHELGIYTIGDLAGWSVDDLTRRFGKHGYDLARRAQGIDDRPLETEHETKSISQETTFSKDVRSGAVLRRTLLQQSESVGRRLRSAGLAGTTVKIKLRWPDFTTLTRQVTLDQPSNQDGEIFEAAITLLEENWRSGQAVRLIGVGVSGLGSPVRQLSLWDDSAEKGRRLQSALDELRERFGKDVLQRGAYFGAPDDDATDENAS
ncbi:MAG: DNA polymerase IV [Anaerolineales bacterium]